MLLSHLSNTIGANLIGQDAEFIRVSTDTRSIQSGDFFVALQGEHFDGHEYLDKAVQSGAMGAMVSRQHSLPVPQVLVTDTRLGLGALAKAWLNQFSPEKIAITGSSGKTTVKEMVASILSRVAPTLATQGNLNNDIGVPLTLCRVTQEHRFAVVEMGANHVGEIAYTVGLVEPHVALVNNVAAAHLEGFGSLKNVAKAKSEIYQGLGENGVAVINLDDEFAGYFLDQSAHCQRITFSMTNTTADIHLVAMQMNKTGCYQFDASVSGQVVSISLSLIGRHNVSNALAAIAVCLGAGCSAADVVAGLSDLKAVPGRLRVVEELKGLNVIDDTYNANPGSMRSAVDVLASLEGETCLVLGCMAELGGESVELHREVGAYAAQRGLKTVYALGEQAAHYRDGYQSVSGEGEFIIAENHQLLAEDLLARHADKTILIKGSRSSAMEKVIENMIRSQQPVGSNN